MSWSGMAWVSSAGAEGPGSVLLFKLSKDICSAIVYVNGKLPGLEALNLSDDNDVENNSITKDITCVVPVLLGTQLGSFRIGRLKSRCFKSSHYILISHD